MGDSENNMDNTRTTSSLARARRRARVLSSRGRVRPRRLGLSKVVDVVSNTNDALGTTVGSKYNGKYSAAALTAFDEGSDADKAFFTGVPCILLRILCCCSTILKNENSRGDVALIGKKVYN